MTVQVDQRPTWEQFAAWALFGACAAFVFVGAFTIGPLAIVPAGLAAGLAVFLRGGNVSAAGAAAGVGVWGFVLGWLNRNGPGPPWPFWLAGVVLVAVPSILFICLRRRSR